MADSRITSGRKKKKIGRVGEKPRVSMTRKKKLRARKVKAPAQLQPTSQPATGESTVDAVFDSGIDAATD